MNIGFDFDKIFIDYPPFVPHKLIDYLYKKKSKKTLSYRIPNKLEQSLRLITHASFLRKPIKENLDVLTKRIGRDKTKNFLISSRFGFLQKKTTKLIDKHQLRKLFHELHFNYQNKQPHLFKNEVLKKLKINRYVDDDLPLLEYLCQKNKKIKFYWLNPHVEKKLKKNLFAVKNIENIFK